MHPAGQLNGRDDAIQSRGPVVGKLAQSRETSETARTARLSIPLEGQQSAVIRITRHLETKIRMALTAIGNGPLRQGMTELFDVLGYRSDRVPRLDTVNDLRDLGQNRTTKQLSLLDTWSDACALFQLTSDEIPVRSSILQRHIEPGQPESILFLAGELVPWEYSDWNLKYMAVIINRIFAIPVILTYRIRRREDKIPVLTVAAVHRRISRIDETRDVLEYVALVRDIRIDNPAPVHIETLAGLSLERLIHRRGIRRVDELHLAWERALRSVSALSSFDPYKLYLRDLDRYPRIENSQIEREIARRARAGDREAAEHLVTANLPFVISYVKQYRGRGLSLAELVCIGNEGLVKAEGKYDPDKDVKFISYARYWVDQTVIKGLTEQTRSVRIPLNHNASLTKISKIESAFIQELWRPPTDQEIADEMNESVETVRALRRASADELSFDASRDKSDLESAFLGEHPLRMEDADIEQDLEDQARRRFLEKVLRRYLNERERKILVLYFGLDDREELTLEQIGDLLGVTRERIRQIRNRAFDKLRVSPDSAVLHGLWDANSSNVVSNSRKG